MNPRHLILVCTLPLLVIACLLVAAVPIGPRNNAGPWTDFVEHVCISAVLGTMYGVTTIAAAWAALGPGWVSVRIPLSLVAVALLGIALEIGARVHHVPAGFTTMMCASIGVQWLLSQVPLWGMAVLYDLRLRHSQDPMEPGSRGQFGIRELMAFTAVVGVLLGIGRVLLAGVAFDFLGDRELPIFLFLVGAAMLMTLPLVFAAFLTRRWVFAVLACLGFNLTVTLIEWPVIGFAFRSFGGPDLGHLIGINGFTTLWVLAFVGMVRLSGYHFRQPISPLVVTK